MTIHRRLEERLAAFKGTDVRPAFGSGYLANIGTIQALGDQSSVIFSDELNTRRSSRAAARRRPPSSSTGTATSSTSRGRCARRCPAGASGRPLIVTDSVFSMDGDIAPLEGIVELCARQVRGTVVDEAHAIRLRRPGGRGAVVAAGLEGEVDAIVGTLGKALGAYGAFVAARPT